MAVRIVLLIKKIVHARLNKNNKTAANNDLSSGWVFVNNSNNPVHISH